MVEFMSGYLPPMDREFDERPVKPTEEVTFDIEKPIIPIGEIGTTSVDVGQGNILQGLESNIRIGAKKVQFVFTPGRGGVSSGPSSFGKEVRQALREKAKASGTELIGVELSPAIVSGLAGNDGRGGLNEQARQDALDKVKDAIRFAADVSGGGCVDLWSQEFLRPMATAKWNTGKKRLFYENSPEELKDPTTFASEKNNAQIIKYLIDERTGKPVDATRYGDTIRQIAYKTAGKSMAGKTDKNGRTLKDTDYVDENGNYVDPDAPDAYQRLQPVMKDGEFVTAELGWKDILRRTEEYNQNHKGELKKEGREDGITPEEYLYRQKINNQLSLLRGQANERLREFDRANSQLQSAADEFNDARSQVKGLKGKSQEEIGKWIEEQAQQRVPEEKLRLVLMGLQQKDPDSFFDKNIENVKKDQQRIRALQEQALSYKVQEEELKEARQHIKPAEEIGKKRAFEGYADAAIDAMNVTKERKLEKPIYVGPEIGWAVGPNGMSAYGGHPQEFKELVIGARKAMVQKLVKQGMEKDFAEEKAKTHIKGMMDTSHLAMWYKHFVKDPKDTEEKHLKKFTDWMKDEVKDLVKAGVVGGVQVVDTMTGEHAHLPAGQGSFDVANLVKAMKEAGFNGPIISEGHEDDTAGFGQGRILTETWKAFGSPMGNAPRSGGKMGLNSWGGVQGSYFGHTNRTPYVVGGYVPSNDWTLWSETPLE